MKKALFKMLSPMKNLYKIPLFILAILLASCSEENNVDSTHITVLNIEEGIKNMSDIQLSKYASSVEYIPLETSNESFLGEISDFVATDSNFYLCSTNGNSVMEFSNDGKFVKAIGTKGRGPGEHMGIDRIFPTQNEGIGIMTFNKSILYDKSGNYVMELPGFGNTGLNRAERLLPYKNDKYICTHRTTDTAENKLTENIYIIDSTGAVVLNYELGNGYEKPTDYLLLGKRLPMPRPFVAALYKYNDEYRFANGRFDTVFTYLPDYGKKECYVMEYGKYYSLTYETLEYEKRIDASANPQLMETDDFLLFRMSLPTEVWTMYNGADGKADVLFLYDKTDKKLSLLKPDKQNKISSFVNDIDGGAAFTPFYMKDNIMYQIIDAMTFIETARESGSPQMQNIAAQLTDESNPVIMAVRLK